MTKFDVVRARHAYVAWMHAVDDEMERYAPEFYAHLLATTEVVGKELLRVGGERLLRDVIGEAYAVHVGRQAV
jgi:hypothetical protein